LYKEVGLDMREKKGKDVGQRGEKSLKYSTFISGFFLHKSIMTGHSIRVPYRSCTFRSKNML
jgi:hypothetical protein